MPPLSKSIKRSKARTEPLWKGPIHDGITQSMLGLFLSCRERFRVRYILGLEPTDKFIHRLEYGNLWHVCEEAFANGDKQWKLRMLDYAKTLCEKYRMDQEQIAHWASVCAAQFLVYIDYWANHKHAKKKNVYTEKTFSVPYDLPSGRTVLLRGKWDSVDVVAKQTYLQENKTMGDIDEERVAQRLAFDLQTGMYLSALYRDDACPKPVYGVRYNVVRRPLSGGRHTIRQKKGQTASEFYAELAERIVNDAEFFFMRWDVAVTRSDVETYEQRFLTPILEQLCDWYEWITEYSGDDPFVGSSLHWQQPYGVYNPVDSGNPSELDEYLASGSTVGLHRADKLFKELD